MGVGQRPESRQVVERGKYLSGLGHRLSRGKAAVGGEQLGELVDQRPDRSRHRDRIASLVQAVAHVRSSTSAMRSASMSGSTAPSRIAGRLCDVKPMRWSVTRLCGKLYVRTFADRSPVPTWV